MIFSICQQCNHFSGYLAEGFLVCAMHPSGPENDSCPDFAEVIEDWQPLGGNYNNGELTKDWPGYLTTAERLEVFDKHPCFTGICPQCGASFGESDAIHYDCEECGWIDDSIN